MSLVRLRLNRDDGGSDEQRALEELAQTPDGRGARREFLKDALTVTMGSMTLTILGCSKDPKKEPPKGPIFGFLVTVDLCAGTGKCLTACRTENKVPEAVSRTWVERYVHYKDGSVKVETLPETGYVDTPDTVDPEKVAKAYFVPKLCNQCTDAPCHQVCPTHASLKSPEGVELVDPELCIGCAYCVQACPYGIRFINPDSGYADKCDWCYHRTTKGENPACVEACPTGARLFGRLDDPNSEISKRIATLPTSVLKEYLGAHPVLKYIGLPGDVI